MSQPVEPDSGPGVRQERRVRARRRRPVSTLLFAGAVALFLVVLWPARFGGAASFVVVRGHSMEPTYALGDLVYVRSADDYRPGEIVVYRVPDEQPGAGIFIVHRLRRIEPDGTFVFRGDNNPTDDVFRPTRHDIVGRAVVDLGGFPARAMSIAPLIGALAVAVAVGLLMWPDRDPDSAPGDLAPGEVLVDTDVAGESEDSLADDVLHDLGGATLDRVGPGPQEVLRDVVAEERRLGLVHGV